MQAKTTSWSSMGTDVRSRGRCALATGAMVVSGAQWMVEKPGSCWVAQSRPGAWRAARGASYQPTANEVATALQRST